MVSDLQPWVDALSAGRRSNLRLGELAHRDAERLEEVLERLQAEGYEPPAESTLSKYRTVHKFWVVTHERNVSELERVGVTKLHMLTTHLKRTSGDALAWLEKAKNTSREQLEALIADQPLNERRRQITGPASVIEAFEQGTRRLYQIVNHPHESMIPALEFATTLLSELPEQTIRELWQQAHGEFQ